MEKAETFRGKIQVNHYDAKGLRHEIEENGRLVSFIFRDTVRRFMSKQEYKQFKKNGFKFNPNDTRGGI